MRQESTSRPLPLKAWFTALVSGGVLLALLAANNLTGIWPQPWLFLEIAVGLGSMLVMFQSILVIVFTHPVAPRGEAGRWAWAAGVSTRFWFLLLGMLLAPLGLVLLAGAWKQSHGLALLCGACGAAGAAVAYLAGRPWPRGD